MRRLVEAVTAMIAALAGTALLSMLTTNCTKPNNLARRRAGITYKGNMMITNSDELALHLDRHWGRCEAQTASEVNLERINEGIGRHGSWGLCVRLFQKNGRSYIKHDNVNRKTDGVYLSHCIPDYDDCPKPVYLAFPFTTQELSTAVDDICNRATALWEELSKNDTDDDYDDRDGDNLFRDTLRYP